MKHVNFKPVLGLVAAAVLSACTMMPKYEQPQVAVADTFKYGTAETGIQASSLGWQDYFADPRLHRLIDIALARNTDLRTAVLNAEIYRRQYMIARNDLLPSLTANGSATRSRTAQDLSARGNAYTSEAYNVGLGVAAYEVDLFGRVRSNSEAALQGYFNSASVRDAAHLTLVASVAKAYFNERYAEESMALASRVLKTREATYGLSQLRHKAGVISAIDLRQQEALIESAKADHAAAVQRREQARNALAMLINQPLPEDLPQGLPLSRQFKVSRLPAGLSSDILLNRPDVRAAEFALKQANANIGAARAAFFPRISLTGSFGSVSRELDGLFTGPNMAWSFMPQISLPIFDFGRNQSNLDLAHARKNIAVAQYEKSIKGAFREVADQLAARRTLADQLAAQERGYQAERERLRLVQMRYDNGISSSLDLLDAQRQSYALEQALLLTRQAAMNNRIDLYKELGGGLVDVTAVTPVSAR